MKSARSRDCLLYALVGASICLLLIACTNLASLLLTRALSCQRELAVRAALGAGWNRLARQMLTESLVLAVVGGALGVLLAVTLLPLLVRLVPNSLPVGETPPLDLRMLLWALGLTLGTALGFGAAPAMRIARGAGANGLREGVREGSSRRTERIRTGLVVAEVTVSVVLLVSAGLLIRALWQVQSIDPGFRAEGVLTARTWLQSAKYRTAEQRSRFYERGDRRGRSAARGNSRRVHELLAVRDAWRSLAGHVRRRSRDFRCRKHREPCDSSPLATFRCVQHSAARRGRGLLDSDAAAAPAVAVVSESFARTHWPGQDAIGRQFEMAEVERTIVGIVGDVRFRGLERERQ